MALQRQKIQLPLTGSLDTKTDAKNVKGPAVGAQGVLPQLDFLELENAVYTATGSLKKRYGYSAFTANIHPSSSISAASALKVFNNSEMLLYGSKKFYSYSEAATKWLDKGSVTFASSEKTAVVSGGRIFSNPTAASGGGYTAYAANARDDFSGSTNYISLTIVDNTTGSVVASHSFLGDTMACVEYFSSSFVVFYKKSGANDLVYKYVSTSDLTTVSAEQTLQALGTATGSFDTAVANSKLYYGWNSGTDLKLSYISALGGASTSVTVAAAASAGCISLLASSSSNVRISWGVSTTNIYTRLYDSALTALHSATNISTTAHDNILVSCQNPETAGSDCLFFVASDNTIGYSVTAGGTATEVTGLGASSRIKPFNACAPQSKPVVYSSNIYFLACSYRNLNATQKTIESLFLVDWKGIVVARLAIETHILESATAGNLPALIESGGIFYGVGNQITVAQTTTGVINNPTVVYRYKITLGGSSSMISAEVGKNLHIAGSILYMYDGDSVVEHGFLQTPEANAAPAALATGAALKLVQSASYGYAYVYSWTDAKGNKHRSAPYFLTVSTPASGSDNIRVTHSVTALTFTSKTDVRVEIYRTVASGSTYYLVTTPSASNVVVANSQGAFAAFVDDVADAAITDNEILYTAGGVLDATSAEPCKSLTSYKTRLITLNAEGNSLQYSKKIVAGAPVEFNDAFLIPVDTEGGKGVSVATMDDYLVIFKERGIQVTSGEGPNELGEQDDFRSPQTITADVGCSDPASVVSTPMGLMFKSEKGIYLLRRNLSVEYVGDKVESYNANSITSAVLLPNTNQVRFTTDGGVALVYDYYHGRWSVFTNISAVDATIYNDRYTYLKSDGTVLYENSSSFSDNGSYIVMKIVTAWMQLAGIQGYQRVYNVQALGDYKSAHQLNVSFGYDFSSTWAYTGTRTFSASGVYQTEFCPTRQKCQAIRVKIVDSETTGDNEGFSLSNFALEVGIKSGLNKNTTAVRTT